MVLDSTWVYFHTTVVWFYRKAYINMNDFKLNSNAPNGELHTKWEDYKKTLNKLTPEEAKRHDEIFYYEALATAEDEKAGIDGTSKLWDKVRSNLDWFRQHNAKAYMVLLD